MSKPVICIGAAFVDELFHLAGPLLTATTNRSTVTRSAGGVSRNIAHQLALLDVPVHLISVFGNDTEGDWLKQTLQTARVHLGSSVTADAATGRYTGVINQDGSLHAAFLSNPLNEFLTIDHLEKNADLLQSASMLLADTNISIAAITWLIAFCRDTKIRLVIEPVSVPPASKLSELDLHGVSLVTPNEDELPALCSKGSGYSEQELAGELLSRGVKKVWVHKGENGSSFYSEEECFSIPVKSIKITDSTGAGDAAVAGFIFGWLQGMTNKTSIETGHLLAGEVLQIKGSIAPGLDKQKLLTLSKQNNIGYE